MVGTTVRDIHSYPLPVIIYLQCSFCPVDWCWVYGLAFLTYSYGHLDSCSWCHWANSPYEVVRHTPGCPLLLWITIIWSAFNSSTWIVPINGLGPFSIFIAVNHLWGTLVSWSAIFLFDGTNTMSTVNSYSSTSFFREFSHLLISISVAALVRTHVLPIRVSDTQWCMHTESVFTCMHVALPLESQIDAL